MLKTELFEIPAIVRSSAQKNVNAKTNNDDSIFNTPLQNVLKLKVDKNVTKLLLNNLGFNDTNWEFHSKMNQRPEKRASCFCMDVSRRPARPKYIEIGSCLRNCSNLGKVHIYLHFLYSFQSVEGNTCLI